MSTNHSAAAVCRADPAIGISIAFRSPPKTKPMPVGDECGRDLWAITDGHRNEPNAAPRRGLLTCGTAALSGPARVADTLATKPPEVAIRVTI